MFEHVFDEVPAPPDGVRIGIAEALREPPEGDGEHQEHHQRQEEVRKSGNNDEYRWHDTVERAAPSPRRHHADEGPGGKCEHSRDANEAEGPRQGGEDHLRDRVREKGERCPEMPGEHVANVGEVLVEGAFAAIYAESDLEGL